MIDAIFSAARAVKFRYFVWRHVQLYASRLFERRSPTSLDRVITFVSPYMVWYDTLNSQDAVARWAAAVLAINYTEEVGQSVVDGLFEIARIGSLRPHIPVDVWRMLKRQPSLPQFYAGELWGSYTFLTSYIRGLGDIEILKSYFLVFWLDQCFPSPNFVYEMKRSFGEDFGGIEMEGHRKDLTERLDQILGRLNGNDNAKAVKRYTKLRNALLEIHSQ